MSDAQPEFTMSELIALCEDEYDAEKWDENGPTRTADGLQSIVHSNALGHMFESRWQVVKRPQAVASIARVAPLSRLVLTDPELRLYTGNKKYRLDAFQAIGEVTVGYVDTIIDATTSTAGLEYTGPHMVGIVDTSQCDTDVVAPGEYNFSMPLKFVQVSDIYIPHELN